MKSRTRDAIFKVIRRTAKTSASTTQDWEADGLGHPRGGIFFGTWATSDDTNIDHASISIGFTDGSNERCSSVSMEHNVTTMDCKRMGRNDSCLSLINPTAAASVGCQISLDSTLDNGYRMNYDNANGARLLSAILIGGDEVQVKAGDYISNATIGGSVDCDCGFDPDIVLTSAHRTSSQNSISDYAAFSAGCAVREGASSIKQISMNILDSDNVPTSQVSAIMSSNYAVQNVNPTGVDQGHEYSWISGGFRVTTRLVVGGKRSTYLAIKLPEGMRWSLDWRTEPTSTGTQSYSLGWRPQLLIGCTSYIQALNTVYTAWDPGMIGYGAIAEGSMMSSISIATEDNQAWSDTQSVCDRRFINTPWQDGSHYKEATAQLKDYGYDIDYTTVSSPAKYHWILAIEESKKVASRTIIY